MSERPLKTSGSRSVMPPSYFEEIQKRARQRWNQLEGDPELAGPWEQLFLQVQSPRHVVSELLQNADDAGAQEAGVSIEGGEFVFWHNGEDFNADQFGSICRFAYSNKKTLHTIGFRGIGFKSTFSLGDEVRLFTPTLTVLFRKSRFTEPVWISDAPTSARTEVRVTFCDEHQKAELAKNLKDWLQSPASLLFFRTLRKFQVEDTCIHWSAAAAGPVPNSHYLTLGDGSATKVLLLRSTEERLPQDAIDEILKERGIVRDGTGDMPPARVEIVLGIESRLYVVLPTGVKTALPFACNAPFIQDPARYLIKDPSRSPTNRWLLKRIGELAGATIVAWLQREDLSLHERARAYLMLSDVDRNDASLQGSVATIVEQGIEEILSTSDYFLTASGDVVDSDCCVDVPYELHKVWTSQQISTLFDESERQLLCLDVDIQSKAKLLNWNLASVTKDQILDCLEQYHLPRPDSWSQLLQLWHFVADDVCRNVYYKENPRRNICIFPVKTDSLLHSAAEVVRIGEKRILQSDDDWKFLNTFLLPVDQDWLTFIADELKSADEAQNVSMRRRLDAVQKVLEVFKLQSATDVSRIIETVSNGLGKECSQEDVIRLAQIAAKLSAKVPDSFQYMTRDKLLTTRDEHLLSDARGELEPLIAPRWYIEHSIVEEYEKEFRSCSKDDWHSWIASGKSGLHPFVPLKSGVTSVYGRARLKNALALRRFDSELGFPYRTDSFRINDWDFADEHWKYWKSAATSNPGIWARVMAKVLQASSSFWGSSVSATVVQIATTGRETTLAANGLDALWISKFRELPCLLDTNGIARKPSELLRRTPATESMLQIEPFLRAEDDTEANRPLLIKLGVNDISPGPQKLIERIYGLSLVRPFPEAMIAELSKWYSRLDQQLSTCSTGDLQVTKESFASRDLILTEKLAWTKTADVFITASDVDVPDAPLIHPAFRYMTLWPRVGVNERPTLELSFNWLKALPSRQKLDGADFRRVSALLQKLPDKVWQDTGHWLNLEREWVPVETLPYSISMRTLIQWGNMFVQVKRKTADFTSLGSDACSREPFALLPSLASQIVDVSGKEIHVIGPPSVQPWIEELGRGLSRVCLDDSSAESEVRSLGSRLARTKWQVVTSLKAEPQIDGVPAGTSRSIDAFWDDTTLYVVNKSVPSISKAIAHEISRVFNHSEISDAILYCIERSADSIQKYLASSFNLAPVEVVQSSAFDAKPATSPVPSSSNGSSSTVTTPDTPAIPVEQNDVAESSWPQFQDLQFDDTKSPVDITAGNILSDAEHPEVAVSDKPARVVPKRESRPSLIELYAATQGYQREGEGNRFVHPDGSWIQRSTESDFPWLQYSIDGNIVQSFWTKESCLEKEPLAIDAAIWNLLQDHPDSYSMLLRAIDDSMCVLSGKKLLQLRADKLLTLYAANYRLVYRADDSV